MTSYWNHKNIPEGDTTTRLAVQHFAIETAKKYGLDPATRFQAAAHEAGHVVMATALSERVIGARIFSRQGRWLGANRRIATASRRTPDVADTLSLVAAVCNNLAGYGGEVLSNCAHPSSSLDERFRAQQIIAVLADSTGIPPGYLTVCTDLIVKKALESNLSAFRVVRKHLADKRRLLPSEAARLLKSIEPIELFLAQGEDKPTPEVVMSLIHSYVEGVGRD